jgi:RES domain-containing protein
MAIAYSGKLYRALNPVYAREPISGRGAELYGGRFNPKGVPALYASTSVVTALREANQVGDLQPTTLVCYRAQIENVFDTTDIAALEAAGLDEVALADPTWRDQMRSAGEARTQRFARDLIAQGYNGLLVRSFAKGAGASDMNLVLWAWAETGPASLELIDDEGRLK